MRRLRIALWGAAAVMAALSAFLWWQMQPVRNTGTLDIGAPFTLASSKGGTVSSESLKGTPYAMFFGFTHCPMVCPTTLTEMQAAFAALGDVGKDLRMFFVSVDPERDTAQYLADYLTNFDPRIEGLVPTVAELPGIAKAFRVFYQKVPTSDGSYTMDHTATVFLFDRAGKFAGTIAFDEDPKLRVAKLKRLVEK